MHDCKHTKHIDQYIFATLTLEKPRIFSERNERLKYILSKWN